MNAICTIAKRELSVFFNSLIAYMMIGLFLGFNGFFTWLYGNDIFILSEANLGVFFYISSWTLLFFIPAITMKMVAEEKKSGTLELLLTKNIKDRDVILGKFLATIALISIALLATIIYPITLANIGDLDVGSTLCGYLALLLLSMTYAAIGIFASSITSNQIVAFLIAMIIGLCFHVIFGVIAASSKGFLGVFFQQLGTQAHFESIARGVVDSKDLIYFLSITSVGLFLAEISLAKSHVKG
jgi:ABC-2 type transport system permease protein